MVSILSTTTLNPSEKWPEEKTTKTTDGARCAQPLFARPLLQGSGGMNNVVDTKLEVVHIVTSVTSDWCLIWRWAAQTVDLFVKGLSKQCSEILHAFRWSKILQESHVRRPGLHHRELDEESCFFDNKHTHCSLFAHQNFKYTGMWVYNLLCPWVCTHFESFDYLPCTGRLVMVLPRKQATYCNGWWETNISIPKKGIYLSY